MSKAKATTPRQMPEWAKDPLDFTVPPDEALGQGAYAKPAKSWKKALKSKRRKS